MEDHKNDPACMSCHMKIDPWGIAFENFDAVGKWRDSIGKTPSILRVNYTINMKESELMASKTT